MITIENVPEAVFTLQFLFFIIQFRRLWCKCLHIRSKSTRIYNQQIVDKAKKFLVDFKTICWDLLEEIQKKISWPIEGEFEQKTQVGLSRKMEIAVERMEKVSCIAEIGRFVAPIMQENVYWIFLDMIKEEKKLYCVDKSFWNIKYIGFQEPPSLDRRIYEYLSILKCKSEETMTQWLDGAKDAFYSPIIRLEEHFLEQWDYTAQVVGSGIGMKIWRS